LIEDAVRRPGLGSQGKELEKKDLKRRKAGKREEDREGMQRRWKGGEQKIRLANYAKKD